MKTILFRGKCAISGDWVFGDLIHGVGHKSGNLYMLPNKTNLAYVKHCDPLDGVRIDPETVGQYTGREDAEINGDKVWEGDIIENCDTKELQLVYWNEDEAAWYCRYLNNETRIVSLPDSLGNLNKKIGNIHDTL